MSRRQGVAILGASGSIGASMLEVLERHRERYRIVALSAHRDVDAILELCRVHQPALAVMNDDAAAARLSKELRKAALDTEVMAGEEGLAAVAGAADADIVVAAIVGAAGVASTLAAARAGKRLLLANKEAVVCAGALLMSAVAEGGAELVPVDSEHNAIFQCLRGRDADCESIILPASGGPFREWSKRRLAAATPEQACAHPVWPGMGAKISVDSATLMNKGLELIEASHLFSLSAAAVRVLIHPQAIVHGVVQFGDGAMIAHLSPPDMRMALASALAWPQRLDAGCAALDLAALGDLSFHEPDRDRFPCLRLAEEAAAAGGDAPLRLNAANEVAVEAFLCKDIGFSDIPTVIANVMETGCGRAPDDLEALEEMDRAARGEARQALRSLRR